MTNSLSKEQRSSAILLTIRAVWHLVSIIAVSAWGFIAWSLPMPGIAFGVGALIISVLLWALFLSPRPALRGVDRFAQSMIELLLLAAAVAALIDLGVAWLFAAIFGIAGAVLGFLAGSHDH